MKAFILFLAAAAVFGLFSGSNEPVASLLRGTAIEPTLRALHNGNSILFNVSVGYLSSFIFWLIVVQYPEVKRRALLRDNLARQYQDFKESVIAIILDCSVGSHALEFPKQLCDHLKFKEFFSGNGNPSWDDVLNGLQNQRHYMQDLLVEFELLTSEVAYVLNNVPIQDPKVHQSFKRFSRYVFRLKNSSVYSYDSAKYIGEFIWEILARWSFVDGQHEDDFIEEMIRKL